MELQGLRYTKSADEPMKEMMFADGTGNHVRLCALGNIRSYPMKAITMQLKRDHHPLIGQTGMFVWVRCLRFVTCNLVIMCTLCILQKKERTAVAIITTYVYIYYVFVYTFLFYYHIAIV